MRFSAVLISRQRTRRIIWSHFERSVRIHFPILGQYIRFRETANLEYAASSTGTAIQRWRCPRSSVALGNKSILLQLTCHTLHGLSHGCPRHLNRTEPYHALALNIFFTFNATFRSSHSGNCFGSYAYMDIILIFITRFCVHKYVNMRHWFLYKIYIYRMNWKLIEWSINDELHRKKGRNLNEQSPID